MSPSAFNQDQPSCTTNGNNPHFNDHATQDHFSDVRIPLNDQYAFTPRKLKVITIGAGFSGLLMAHKFQHRFPEMQEYVEHVILERHGNIGGTVGSIVSWLKGLGCEKVELIETEYLADARDSGSSIHIRACSVMYRLTSM
jgi:hypothetical protein